MERSYRKNKNEESSFFVESFATTNVQKDENELPDYCFTWLDIIVIFLSMGTYLADIATDVLVMLVYWKINESSWAGLTLTFLIVPAIVMQIFSTRWYMADGHKFTLSMAVVHVLMMGPIRRYIFVLYFGFKARKSKRIHDYQLMYSELSDVSMLRLFECFLESAPQLVLQLYIMIRVEEGDHILTGISACFSLLSLSWAIVAYSKALRAAASKRRRVSWTGVALQTVWRVGMVLGRITAIVLFATVFQEWTLLVLGIHWLLMTGWIVAQDTDFCNTWWEERLFNIVVGIIYVFCFFNMKEGKSRWRLSFYYAVTVVENSVMILLWWPQRTLGMWYNIPALFAVWGGFLLGVLCMVLYYVYFHPASVRKCHCCSAWRKLTHSCHTCLCYPSEAPAVSPYKRGWGADGKMNTTSSESSVESIDIRDFTDLRCSYDTPSTNPNTKFSVKRMCAKHLTNPRHHHLEEDVGEVLLQLPCDHQNEAQVHSSNKKTNIEVVGDARTGFKLRKLHPQHANSDPIAKSKPMLLPRATSTPEDDLRNHPRVTGIERKPKQESAGPEKFCATPNSHKPGSPNTLVKNWVKRNQEMFANGEGCFSYPTEENIPSNQPVMDLNATKTNTHPETQTKRNPLRMKSFNKRDRFNPRPPVLRERKRKNKDLRTSFREAFGFHVIDLDDPKLRVNHKGKVNRINQSNHVQLKSIHNSSTMNAIKHRLDEPPLVTSAVPQSTHESTKRTKDVDSCIESCLKERTVENIDFNEENLYNTPRQSTDKSCPCSSGPLVSEISSKSAVSSEYFTPACTSFHNTPSSKDLAARKKLAFKEEKGILSHSTEKLLNESEENTENYRLKIAQKKDAAIANKTRKVLGSIDNTIKDQ